MKLIIIHSAYVLACYVLGAATWPKLRLALLAFRDDPVGVIKADIAKLEALKNKFTKKSGT